MYLEFREPTNDDELRALLEVHERVYGASDGLTEFVSVKESSADTGQVTRHFGLFEGQGQDSRAVGYLRVVEAIDPARPRLPLLKYFARPSRIRRMLSVIVGKHGMAIEGGRLSLLPTIGAPRASLHIVQSVVALYGIALDVPLLLVCFPHHQRFYESLGFRRIFSEESIRTPCDRRNGVCMYGVRLRASRSSRKARLMLDAYRRFGAIAYRSDARRDFSPNDINPTSLASAARFANCAA